MSYSCGCDDSDYETVSDEYQVATEPGVCIECDAEIKPGDIEYVFKMALMHEDATLDDLDEDVREAWLAPDGEGDVHTYRHCERCGDLALSVMDLGFCYSFGTLIESHRDYIEEKKNE